MPAGKILDIAFLKFIRGFPATKTGIASLGKEFPGSGNNCLSAIASAGMKNLMVTMVTTLADDFCTQLRAAGWQHDYRCER
jgi:hypothetical protein